MNEKLSIRTTLVALPFCFIASGAVAQTSTESSVSASAAAATSATVTAPVSVPVLKEPDKRKTKATISAGIAGRRMQDEYVRSNSAGPALGFEGEAEFNKYFSGRIDVGALFNTGSSSAVFSEEGKPFTGLVMAEAALKFRPLKDLTLRGGVIETKFSSNPSIFYSRGFPGLQESYKLGGDRLNLTLSATQTMPTAGGVTQRYEREETVPHLLLHSLALGVGEKDDLLSGNASVTHFTFGDLSAAAAQESRTAGNSISGRGRTAARFDYEFEGFEASFNLKSRLTRNVRLEMKGAALTNTAAPTGQNLGTSLTFSPSWENDAIKVKPQVGYFYNESDTLPASYTNTGVGQNNRHGFIAALETELKDPNLTVTGKWVQANEITDKPFTADRTIISLSVETDYDLL